jgi:hypothetical protein
MRLFKLSSLLATEGAPGKRCDLGMAQLHAGSASCCKWLSSFLRTGLLDQPVPESHQRSVQLRRRWINRVAVRNVANYVPKGELAFPREYPINRQASERYPLPRHSGLQQCVRVGKGSACERLGNRMVPTSSGLRLQAGVKNAFSELSAAFGSLHTRRSDAEITVSLLPVMAYPQG